ncbi:MAG: hypothetical protein A2934_03930 [Candidatus Sungbacteria bacterium RIFCSPLOWO2_01_FULL_47_10]|uniref:Uncharacterized protein n=1 Tax=Candidatus Sungbacteria bacterium RIFCSPLOWO2_01_FULL_47_10 TaxID=1802276 RepID=A0A1G2L582_9BACT|nr:MAG: hypothetical protein A2934_03930 [Candidatus Sungbacteria bacterium RIFCSPLOWO2_01_FULL_47_10]
MPFLQGGYPQSKKYKMRAISFSTHRLLRFAHNDGMADIFLHSQFIFYLGFVILCFVLSRGEYAFLALKMRALCF